MIFYKNILKILQFFKIKNKINKYKHILKYIFNTYLLHNLIYINFKVSINNSYALIFVPFKANSALVVVT